MKQNNKNWLDKIVDRFTDSNIYLGINSLIWCVLFVYLFMVFWEGVQNDLFSGYVEVFTAFCLMYIVFKVSDFHITDNGVLGTTNGFFLFLSFLGILSGEYSLMDLGFDIVKMIWATVLIATLYIYVKQNWEGFKKWLLKYRKQ